MAAIKVKLILHWWWRPLIYGAVVFFWLFGRFIGHEPLDRLIERYCKWVARHSVSLKVA